MQGHATGISDEEFGLFRDMLYRVAGISLSPAKKTLVKSRLAKRLQHLKLASYGDYFRLIHTASHAEERQMAVDLLTTNETYFFREPRHFEFLRDHVVPGRTRGSTLRVWSAACSSGEEAYSIAMLLDEHVGPAGWEVMASDLSNTVLTKARRGCYSMERSRHIPERYLLRYCLKGIGSKEGTLMVDPALRKKVTFRQINLKGDYGSIGCFDVIFARNVMIYFDMATKRDVAARLLSVLRPGGYLIVGHSETLNGVVPGLRAIAPSVYQNLPRVPGK